MKKLSLLLFVICLTFGACNTDEVKSEKLENTREEDFAELENMRSEIIQFSQVNSGTCTNPEEWGMIQIDPSGCSENGGFILYSKKVNFSTLEKKINDYNTAKGEIFTKWKILVDLCSSSIKPSGVKCVENKPALSFQSVK